MAAIPLKKIEGKYEILEKLREGGMGAIYKVRHLLLDEVRVIKVMRPQLVTDEELKDRFLREARLATRIRHPNIAHLYDCIVDEEDGTAYIVMEYIGGLTLEDVLKTVGPPPLGLALEIAQQSLRALGYLHAKGMIHRDISPDNLMLTEDADGEAQVKLIDLGIAKSLLAGEGQHTATGMFLGKVRYASPEQFSMEGSQPMDARSDLYSFGLVLYELLTGRYPIAGRDPQSIIAGHLFRQPLDMAEADPAGRISPGLRLAVMASLAKNPEERPQSAQELSRALAPFRAPSDFTRADLMRLLSRTATAVEVAPASATGSTQQRLDEQFRRVTTPAPAPAMTLVPPLEPKTVPQGEAALDEQQRAREIAAFIAEIEATLARGDYRTAEAQLYAAEANLGALDAFPNLYDRVAELRRRDLEGKAAALVESARRLAGSGSLQEALGELRRAHRLDAGNPEIAALIRDLEEAERRQAEELRRAESLAAAVAAAEARLAEGKLDAAWSLIDLAVAEQGDAPAFAEPPEPPVETQAAGRDRSPAGARPPTRRRRRLPGRSEGAAERAAARSGQRRSCRVHGDGRGGRPPAGRGAAAHRPDHQGRRKDRRAAGERRSGGRPRIARQGCEVPWRSGGAHHAALAPGGLAPRRPAPGDGSGHR